ncbi:MAG: NYN domain-containing protein [Ilumatobacter sp.]
MADIEHRHLRSALEFAVLIATEGQKRRPPLPFPKELKPFLAKPRLATGALGRVRRIVEADSAFRGAISAGAVPELVDEVGRLWLAGLNGWEQEASVLIAGRAAESESKDLHRDLKRAEKRREAAELATARIQADVLARDHTIAAQQLELDLLRADLAKADDEISEVRTELIDTRNELRHARDRERAAQARAEQPRPSPMPVAAPTADAASESDSRVDPALLEQGRLADDARRRLEEAHAASQAFASEMERLLVSGDATDQPANVTGGRGSGRTPISLPGGVIASSAEAAAHLVRAGALLLIDGYNVAKLAWPDRRLEDQREALIGRTENLARRHGANITIVFDGDSTVGAHTGARRTVRVMYSPAGVIADDVIRAEVDRLPADQSVVVVTNDREIVEDVRRSGANVVPSNAFIAVL